MITSIGITDAGNGTLKVIVNGEHDVADMMRRLADLELAIENAKEHLEGILDDIRYHDFPDEIEDVETRTRKALVELSNG